MPRVLIIDDNEGVFTALEVLLDLHGIESVYAATPEAGLEQLARGGLDLVIQDMNFSRDTTSGVEGVELFHKLRQASPEMPVILLTAWTHLEDAVQLVKAGAADYLAKPWDDDKLITTVRNLLDMGELKRERRRSESQREAGRKRLAEDFDLCGLVYVSDAMHHAVSLAAQVAASDVPVMITGPNGVGKERIADIVHANSPFADGPFVKVNIGALPLDLMESELFGAEAGAFTGANRAREGRFEAADGGSLFLDEIGELSPTGQVKLLRVLQTGEFERLGSSKTRKASARIISATNADLVAAIRTDRFREDLFYRLNVIQIRIPSLSERPEDILPLVQCFLHDGPALSEAAARALVSHSWPGNVRELENCIRRARLLAGDEEIQVQHLGLDAPAPAPRPDASGEPSREQVEAALTAAGGTVAKAARRLGLSRQALYRRMEKFGIGNE